MAFVRASESFWISREIMIYRAFLVDIAFCHEPGAGAVDFLEGNHGLRKRSQPLAEKERWMVPNLHLHALGAARDVPTQEQADYTGVKG